MRDIDIRGALDRQLRQLHAGHSDTLIRHELGLEEGRRRIDLAVVNGSLAGWEIKSDVDTLYRLEGQAETYGRVFDYVTLATTNKYSNRAVEKLPTWWGVVVAERSGDDVRLRSIRKARRNRHVDPMSLVQLLWRDEAMDVLRRQGNAKGLSGKARWFAWDRLASSMPLQELQTVVREQIRARPEWTGGSLPSPNDATSRRIATL